MAGPTGYAHRRRFGLVNTGTRFAMTQHVATLREVTLAYGKTQALRGLSLEIPAGLMVGLIGPDGVGKSSLLSLIAGARALQGGEIQALGGDMRNKSTAMQSARALPTCLRAWARTSTPRCRWKRICSSSGAFSGMTRPSAGRASTI